MFPHSLQKLAEEIYVHVLRCLSFSDQMKWVQADRQFAHVLPHLQVTAALERTPVYQYPWPKTHHFTPAIFTVIFEFTKRKTELLKHPMLAGVTAIQWDAHFTGKESADVFPQLAPFHALTGLATNMVSYDTKNCLPHTLIPMLKRSCPKVTRLCVPYVAQAKDIQVLGENYPDLEEFSITLGYADATGITDDVLRDLSRFRKLKKFEIMPAAFGEADRFTDAGLVYLSACSDLESIHITSNKNITDHGMRTLIAGCKHLQTVHLHYIDKITGEWIPGLTNCKQLRKLFLSSCPQVLTSRIEYLQVLAHLETLYLDTISEETLKVLATKFPALNYCGFWLPAAFPATDWMAPRRIGNQKKEELSALYPQFTFDLSGQRDTALGFNMKRKK
jgi:hypothetical protein